MERGLLGTCSSIEGVVVELQQAYLDEQGAVAAVEGRRITVDLLQAEASRILVVKVVQQENLENGKEEEEE